MILWILSASIFKKVVGLGLARDLWAITSVYSRCVMPNRSLSILFGSVANVSNGNVDRPIKVKFTAIF